MRKTYLWRIAALLGAVVVVILLRTTATTAQQAAGSCVAPSASDAAVLARVRTIVADTSAPWPEVRDSLHIPSVQASTVTVATDSLICARAAAAYDSALVALAGTAPRSRRVLVIPVGDRYIVRDPLEKAGEFGTSMLLDSLFTYVSAWTL